MIRKKRNKIIIGAVLSVICIGGIIWRISYINHRFPEETIVDTRYGESGILQQDVEMTVVEQLFVPFGEKEDRSEAIISDGYNYVVKVQLKNYGAEEAKVDLTSLYVGTMGFTNGIELEKYLEWNENVKTLHPVLQSQEVLEVNLVYELMEFQWKKKDWSHVTEQPYYLQKINYPYLYKWRCSDL